MTEQTQCPDDERELIDRSQLDDATRALDALTAALDGNNGFEVILQRACEQVVRVIPDADLASVSALETKLGRRPSTLACTEAIALHIDARQHASGGPCLAAADSRSIVRGNLREASTRWPDFASAAEEAEIDSYLAAPLFVGDQQAGALNLYSRDDHSFRDIDAALLDLYVTATEGVLRASARQREARQLADQLANALNSRAVIDQAKGILMARMHVNADEAFATLVNLSQRENVKVRNIAHRIVEQVTGE